MHRAGCEEVNYNPVTDGAGKGREGGRLHKAPPAHGAAAAARGTRAARRVPWVRGATRGLWVRPLAWGPCAPNTPLWPQIVPGWFARSLCFGAGCCVWDLLPPVAGGVGVIVTPLVSS